LSGSRATFFDEGAHRVVIRVGIRDEDTDFGELSGDRLRDAAMPEVNHVAVATIARGKITGGCTMPTALIDASSNASACGEDFERRI
jgi:hypothetical protein